MARSLAEVEFVEGRPGTIGRNASTVVTVSVLGKSYWIDRVGTYYFISCERCGGTGYLDCYAHVFEGVCFKCGGTGIGSSLGQIESATRKMRARARRDVKADERYAAEAAEAAEREAAEAIVEAAREVERKAAAAAALAGSHFLGAEGDKVTFTGTVKVAMIVDGYAYGTTQIFLIVKGDGFTVKAYTSAGWAREAVRDQAVTLTATIKKLETRDDERVTVVKAPKIAKVVAA